MVVRDKVGRKRYVLFEVMSGGDSLSRTKLGKEIERRAAELPTKLRFEVILVGGKKGIIRTDQKSLSPLLAFLNSFDPRTAGFQLATVKTSGTIKTLKEELPPEMRR